jgi:2-C-methyl-D-erythritol 4-phosphate cytidylyltransferase/2-C-methyl-D-erythritol 2,4-cyclodiphosphate synthase
MALMPRARVADRPGPPLRIGLGCDRHPFDAGRPLILGGVGIPGSPGLGGHSDADVLLHAVCDALLGALGLPDIGRRFPGGDPRYRGAASARFVREAVAEVERAGYAIANVDAVLLAERPRLAPHIDAIRASLARLLGLPGDRVGLKAKSGEGLGWVGRAEGMAAEAVALLHVAPRRPARGAARRTGRRARGRAATAGRRRGRR